MVALRLEPFKYNLQKIFPWRPIFPMLFGLGDGPPERGGGLQGRGDFGGGGQGNPPPLEEAMAKYQINTVPTPIVAWTRP